MNTQPFSPPFLPLRKALPSLLLVASIFLLNYLSRIIFSPLLPSMEQSMGFSHAQAGQIFLYMSVGVSVGYLFNGHLSRALTHRGAVAASAIGLGLLLILAAMSSDLRMLCFISAGYGFAAGFYLPSGIATVTALVEPSCWGKALGVHELAPSSSFILAPLAAELALHLASWRACLVVLGVLQVVMALVFLRYAKGGRFPGRPLRFSLLPEICGRRSFWILTLYFSLAIGASMGAYNMLPLALVTEHGFERFDANTMLSASRIGGLVTAMATGFIIDRIGVKRTLVLYFTLAGASTLGLGLVKGPWIVGVIVAQLSLSSCFFPVGFTALSTIFDTESRSAAISLLMPLSMFSGSGLTPAFIGWMGEHWSFSAGFTFLGALLAAGLLAVPFLKLEAASRR